MSKKRIRRPWPLLGGALWATALSLAGGWPAAAQIGVQVNGTPVQFGSALPVRVDGRVLIPLRAVVEALGAEIRWDAATQTVRGSKSGSEFSLRIGSRDATVNGKDVPLDVPAQLVSGATMVPLRFVAEALGAEVEWNAATQQVVVSGGGGAKPAAARSAERAPERIAGEVVTVRPKANPPTLTVRASGVKHTYEVGPDTIILRGEEGRRGSRVELEEIQVGDQVRLRVRADGAAVEVVEATPLPRARPEGTRAAKPAEAGLVEGEVVAIRDRGRNRSITVRTETSRVSYDVPADSPVSRGLGKEAPVRVRLSDIRLGDRVRVLPDHDGRAARIEATGVEEAAKLPIVNGRVTGEVVSVNAEARPPSITIRSGAARASYEVTTDTILFRAVGTGKAVRAALDEIQPGDTVRIRPDDAGRIAEVVDAQAAAAPAAVEPAKELRILSFTHDAAPLLRADSQVHLTLRGTPGAEVTVDGGALAKDVLLREDPQQVGRYTALLTVPRGLTAKEVPLIAQLRLGSRTAPLVQAAATLSVDSEAPLISDAAPADRSETTSQQPDVYAEIGDGAGSGIDPASVRVSVRERDVSGLVKITPRFLLFTPKDPLPAGPVPVTVSLKDLAGNPAQRSWSFTVRPAPVAIQSVTHDADKPLRVGDVVNVTVKGQPDGRATFSIGEAITGVRLAETAPGTYTGRYTVKEGDQAAKAPVTVQFVSAEGDRSTQQASAPVNLLTREPDSPEITSPGQKIDLGDEVVVEGKAAPGSKVVVEVLFSGKAFFALPVKGTFGSQEVQADKGGRWVTEPFAARLPLGVKKPSLTIRAVAKDASGAESKPAEVLVQSR